MPHSSETTWGNFSMQVASLADNTLKTINNGEEAYQDMLEAYAWAGGNNTAFANLLFHGDKEATTASPEEIAKADDLKSAMIAVHNLYQCMTNGTVDAKDRASDLRRMS